MLRDGALEVHLALLQPQFWKRHSKRRKELHVSVADTACGCNPIFFSSKPIHLGQPALIKDTTHTFFLAVGALRAGDDLQPFL